jgi:hypothetical protein
MNNKGQVVIFGLMLGVVIIILALALAGPVRQSTEEARNTTVASGEPGLDCNNPDISMFNKAACTATDLTLFYFIAGLIFIAGIVLTAKIVFT